MPAVALTDPAPVSSPPSGVGRLAGVDGLRAAAAGWVVLFHIRAFSFTPIPFAPLDWFVRSGSTGVSLFLVLSGFCLYLPFANGRQDRFKTTAFFIRRCRRLLPAYYTAVLICIGLAVVGAPGMGSRSIDPAGLFWQLSTHVLMLHSLFPSTFYSLNGAFWSLALEWQLYLALPLLVYIAARFGLIWAAALPIAVNVIYRLALWAAVSHGLAHDNQILREAVLPNLIFGRWAEFAYGMVAAELYRRGIVSRIDWRHAASLVVLIPAGFLLMRTPLSHMIFGAVFFMLLLVVLAGNNVVSTIFSLRPLVGLGLMSYSLYLVHAPMLWMTSTVLNRYLADARFVMLGLVLSLPAIFAATWLLFYAVERHSLTPDGARRPRPLSDRAGAAVISPEGQAG